MEYSLFEARLLDDPRRADGRLDPGRVAAELGIPVEEAERHLERMAEDGDAVRALDENGRPSYRVVHSPFADDTPTPPESGHDHELLHTAHNNEASPHRKNVALAAILSFFFGPLGIVYSSLRGALFMAGVGLVLLPLTFLMGLIIYLPACAAVGALGALRFNRTAEVHPAHAT